METCVAALCLGELVVNPHQQLIEPFNWVMDWEGMLSLSSMVGLLDKHFFNKWLQVCLDILVLTMQSFISNILFLYYPLQKIYLYHSKKTLKES